MATPIKFGTDGWRAIIARDYTFENLARVTEATGRWVLKQPPLSQYSSAKPHAVALGYDCRFNGRLFAEAVANQLAQMGIRVFLSPAFVSTPMVSLATMQRQCTAGVILTASHNPASYGGFKVKGHFGGPAFPSMIAEIESLVPDAAPAYDDQLDELVESRQIEYYDMEALYINQVRQAFDLKALRGSGLKIGYDAMYGAGQEVFRQLFPKATMLHAVHNPGFGGQAPEPIERNLQEFQGLIRAQKLDFGLATDGDADRIGLFDEQGRFVDSHHILLLLIHYLHKHKGQRGKVVATFSCTSKIQELCTQYGLELQITKIGFKYIGEIMAKEKVLVGGEESGGIAVAGHAPERDGIYIGLILLEMMHTLGKPLSALVDELYSIVGSFSMGRNDLHVTDALKQSVLAACKAGKYTAFDEYRIDQTEDLDGYKFWLGPSRWVMIRPSGTEPVLRVYAQGADDTEVEAILQATVATISS